MTDIPAYREIGLRESNGLSEAKPIMCAPRVKFRR